MDLKNTHYVEVKFLMAGRNITTRSYQNLFKNHFLMRGEEDRRKMNSVAILVLFVPFVVCLDLGTRKFDVCTRF